jgi:cellobiose phosphorylase/cellobionic acid phosphorylase
MDSPLWIADTLVTYVQETGDFRVLDEPVGFFSMPASRARPAGARSVWDHAMLAVRSCFAFRGRKGLCLAGHGDWNDALDGIGRGGRGVSVWLTLAVAFAAGRLAELARRAGRRGDEAALRAMRRTLIGAVNRGAWDGAYYVYGFNDAGEPIGSRRNAEGRIHLNVNTWAILSGAASATGADRTASVLRSIGRLRTPLGYLLLAPPYTARSRRVGRIADMLPGLFENGSVYTHGQAFVAAALVSLGKGDEAWEALKMTMTSRTLPALSTTPPHQQSNFTVGRGNEDFGTQYYSNFSGSLDWYRRTLIRIFGVVADFDGLRIVPCPPRLLRSYEVRKRFRGCDYLVKVENRPRRPGAAPSIRVDGVPIRGNLVPLSARRSCRVDVVL